MSRPPSPDAVTKYDHQFTARVRPETIAEIDRITLAITAKTGIRVRQADFLTLAVAALGREHPADSVVTPAVNPKLLPAKRRKNKGF